MSTIAILALASVIYLFGGYVDCRDEYRLARQGELLPQLRAQDRSRKMINARRTQLIEWRLSLWFALLSPLLGVLTGLLGVWVFVR